MHPHQLHATAALWSLRAARRRLHDRASRYGTLGPNLDAADTLRSPRYGTRGGSGGHSDPVAAALLTAVTRTGADRLEQLADRTTGTLTWLARKLNAAGPGDPLGRLLAAVPDLRPAPAAHLQRWILEADHDVRKALGINADRQPLPGARCPSCGLRRLEAQTSADNRAHWTVICTAGEVCAGNACTCGMPVKAAGVTHIWDATSSLVKRHLDTVDA